MKRSADQQPVRVSDHVAFFSYRWLAWAAAALALTLPGRPVATLPRDAGLLLLCAVITVVATALAQSYVRLARQRPALLALDLVAGAAVLWLSGSGYLPFMPYALAALVLPALLFGWRGALGAAAAFCALDLIGLTLLNPDVGLTGLALAGRPLAPLAFAGLWAAIGQALHHSAPASGAGAGRTEGGALGLVGRPDEAPPGSRPGPRAPDRHRAEPPAPASANLATGPMVLLRAAAEQRADAARRVIYDLNPTQSQSLPTSLDQLGAAAARQSDLEVQVSCSGSPRPLTQAQHSVLLRVAHEALLNVQQHARAHNATLTLAYERDEVTLVVRDDGVGLLDGTYERPGLHALRAVRYRLAELDGQLVVFESEGGGVTVRASLPLEP
ncbi:MAG TPA: histidine kinase [Chloroflexaceae bacterium]|nr:histidine kinase [Chloroflexaceae bacterium]